MLENTSGDSLTHEMNKIKLITHTFQVSRMIYSIMSGRKGEDLNSIYNNNNNNGYFKVLFLRRAHSPFNK